VKKERHALVIVMPEINVPKWFDYRCKRGIPCLWVRGKFPINVALAWEFQLKDGAERIHGNPYGWPELHLVINGQRVPRKGYYHFHIALGHVLVHDLRFLLNEEEWLSIDALLLEHEWNQVQISYEFIRDLITLREWGVFVYKQGTVNWEEYVQFTCPTKDPIMTIEDFKHEDSNDAAVNENRDDQIIGIEDIPSPNTPKVDVTQDTPYSFGFFRRLLYTCFSKCFS
jgi:hypothetical protein